MWDFPRTFLFLGCRLSLGAIAPVMGLVWKIPIRVVIATSLFATLSLGAAADFPLREVPAHTMPVLVQTWDLAIAPRNHDLGAERAVLFCFILLTLSMRCYCSCDEFLTMTYPVSTRNTAPPNPLSQLQTPVGSPPASGDGETSGSTSDNDPDTTGRGQAQERDGIFDAVCDAHCILLDGDPGRRRNPKVCKRRGVKLATLLDTGELFSCGSRALPTYSDWVNAQLRTFHRVPYIQERDNRRCHVDDCFRSGVIVTLFGTVTKRCRVHIENALMAMTSGEVPDVNMSDSAKRPDDGHFAPHQSSMHGTAAVGPPHASATSSRRTSRNSLDSVGLSNLPSASETCLNLGELREKKGHALDLGPTRWHADIESLPADPEVSKRHLWRLLGRFEYRVIPPLLDWCIRPL